MDIQMLEKQRVLALGRLSRNPDDTNRQRNFALADLALTLALERQRQRRERRPELHVYQDNRHPGAYVHQGDERYAS